MRNPVFNLAAVSIAIAALTLGSCQKMNRKDGHHGPKHDEPTQYITINKTLAYGELYTLDLSPYEDKDDLGNITQQATAYTRSAISGLAANANQIYQYELDASQKNGLLIPVDSTLAPVNQQVILTVTEGPHENGGCFGGNNGSQIGKVEAVITLNFSIH